ncbi:MAG: hypothetical protein ACK4WB_00250 [Desulfatiglandales bacterium]
MSIRLLAKDLYRVRREIEELEKRIPQEEGPEREELTLQLRRLQAERDRLKKILDGHKSPPPYRSPR